MEEDDRAQRVASRDGYRLVMDPEKTEDRDMIVARFAGTRMPELGLGSRMFRRGEESAEQREAERKRVTRERMRAKSSFEKRKAAQRQREGRPIVQERFKRRWVLEAAPDDDAAAAGTPMKTFTGVFDGAQKAQYAYIVLNDENNSAEVVPLSKTSFYTFRLDAGQAPVQATDRQQPSRSDAPKKKPNKLISRLHDNIAKALEEAPDDFGYGNALEFDRNKKQEAKVEAQAVYSVGRDRSGDQLDFEEKFDDDDEAADVVLSEEERTKEEPKIKKRPRKARPPSPPGSPSAYSRSPGSQGSSSDSEDDEPLDEAGKNLRRVLKMEEKTQWNSSVPSRSQSPSNSAPASPATSLDGGTKRASTATGSATKRAKVERVAISSGPAEQEVPEHLRPKAGEAITEKHIIEILRYFVQINRRLKVVDLLHILKADKSKHGTLIGMLKRVAKGQKDEKGQMYLLPRQ